MTPAPPLRAWMERRMLINYRVDAAASSAVNSTRPASTSRVRWTIAMDRVCVGQELVGVALRGKDPAQTPDEPDSVCLLLSFGELPLDSACGALVCGETVRLASRALAGRG